MKELFYDVGNAVCVLGGADDSDAAKTASDCLNGVPILGMSGALFLLGYGPVAESVACTFQIQYSSTGNASDAATSNAGMTCTDATMLYSTVSSAGGIKVGYFDISAKGLSDAAGKLFATRTATEAVIGSLIAIPVPGNSVLPSSNSSDWGTWNSVA